MLNPINPLSEKMIILGLSLEWKSILSIAEMVPEVKCALAGGHSLTVVFKLVELLCLCNICQLP